MQRKGYHRLHLPNGEVIRPAVVVFDDQGVVLSWHPLAAEEPGTQWMGGDYHMSNQTAEQHE